MKEINEEEPKSVKQLASEMEELEPKGMLLVQTKEKKLLELVKSIRQELNSYEQQSSTERERILNRLTPVVEKLDDLLSANHLEDLNNRIGQVINKLGTIKKTEDKLQEIVEDRSDLVKKLRQENEQLRHDFIFSEKIKPGVLNLIKLRDNVAGQLQDIESGSNEIFLEALEEKLLEALRKFGVVEVRTSGDEFDPACQDVVEKREVLERRKDKKVLEVLQAGYRHEEKLIRPQKVVIGQFGGETDEQG